MNSCTALSRKASVVNHGVRNGAERSTGKYGDLLPLQVNSLFCWMLLIRFDVDMWHMLTDFRACDVQVQVRDCAPARFGTCYQKFPLRAS